MTVFTNDSENGIRGGTLEVCVKVPPFLQRCHLQTWSSKLILESMITEGQRQAQMILPLSFKFMAVFPTKRFFSYAFLSKVSFHLSDEGRLNVLIQAQPVTFSPHAFSESPSAHFKLWCWQSNSVHTRCSDAILVLPVFIIIRSPPVEGTGVRKPVVWN